MTFGNHLPRYVVEYIVRYTLRNTDQALGAKERGG